MEHTDIRKSTEHMGTIDPSILGVGEAGLTEECELGMIPFIARLKHNC